MDEYLSEREQWERVLQWLREQGPWVLVSIAVVMTGYYGWNYWHSRVEQRYVTAATRYEAVLQSFRNRDGKGEPNLDAGLKLTEQFIKDYPSTGYADQANLFAAGALVENRSFDQAASRLAQVMNSTKDPELGLIARLRLARVQLAQNKPDEALKTLSAVEPGAFAARYSQVRGDALFAKGDREGALREYRAARSAAGDTIDTGLLDLKIDELAHS
ncbi:MAG TPA: tetratricopeptide repeat protein [Steroidobacteraceae bacterium]|nr:tetratricopeptide repeat protein [Steroidobacteraceae bacterium]